MYVSDVYVSTVLVIITVSKLQNVFIQTETPAHSQNYSFSSFLKPLAIWNLFSVPIYSLLIWIFHKLGLMHCMAFGVLASAQGFCKTQWHDVISLLLWVKKIPF